MATKLFCSSLRLPKNIQPLAGTLFYLSSISLSALFCLLYLYADAMQPCLLTPFKCVNTEAIELYAIIFDAVYGSLILSSPLSTLDGVNRQLMLYAIRTCIHVSLHALL